MRKLSTTPSSPEEVQASAQRKPDTSHLLFSHHTHCHHEWWCCFAASPTHTAPMQSHPHPSLLLWLSACLTALGRNGRHACSCRAQLQPASQEIESSSGTRSQNVAGVLQSVPLFCSTDSSVCQNCLEWDGGGSDGGLGWVWGGLDKHLRTHTHTLTSKPICIQVQSHTSTHSGTLTDSRNTPPKSHQTVRQFK